MSNSTYTFQRELIMPEDNYFINGVRVVNMTPIDLIYTDLNNSVRIPANDNPTKLSLEEEVDYQVGDHEVFPGAKITSLYPTIINSVPEEPEENTIYILGHDLILDYLDSDKYYSKVFSISALDIAPDGKSANISRLITFNFRNK